MSARDDDPRRPGPGAARGAPSGGGTPPVPTGAAQRSLCPGCRHVQVITSAKGSVFHLCTRSKAEPRFPKYPPQPVVACSGHERYPA